MTVHPRKPRRKGDWRLLAAWLAHLVLCERDADEFEHGEADFRAPQVEAHPIDQFRPLACIAELLGPQLAVIVAITEVACEMLRLHLEAAALGKLDHLAAALAPGPLQLIGGIDPHGRQGAEQRHLFTRRIVIGLVAHHLVFQRVQRGVDQAELVGLQNQDRVLGEACEALQRLDEFVLPDLGDGPITWPLVIVIIVLVEMIVVQASTLRALRQLIGRIDHGHRQRVRPAPEPRRRPDIAHKIVPPDPQHLARSCRPRKQIDIVGRRLEPEVRRDDPKPLAGRSLAVTHDIGDREHLRQLRAEIVGPHINAGMVRTPGFVIDKFSTRPFTFLSLLKLARIS